MSGLRLFIPATKRWTVLCFGLLALVLSAASTGAIDDPTYQMPPQAIADLIDAPITPSVSVGPDEKTMLLLGRPDYPPIDEVSQPELRLAGIRINPRTNGRSRSWYYNSITIGSLFDDKRTDVQGLPEGAKIGSVSWSPDGKYAAFTMTHAAGIELWVLDVKSGTASGVTGHMLNGVYGSPYRWLSDSKTLVVQTIPEARGEPPVEPTVPSGPTIQENIGGKAPARTYQDMLSNAYDEALFDYYGESQVILATIKGETRAIGTPAIYTNVAPSPDGKYILVDKTHRPYSYTLPYYRFASTVEVWDRDGNLVTTVADLPLADGVPIAFGSVPMGRRSIGWRSDKPATLHWAEAQDGGDAGAEADVRDIVYTQEAPFDGDPVPLASLGLRYGGVMWGSDDLALVSSWWWKTRTQRVWRVHPGKPDLEPVLVDERSWEDRYGDPGEPLMTRSKWGTSVLLTADNGRTLFLSGDGASEEGDRPFLDRMSLETQETTRLFRSEAPYYERPVRLIDPEKMLLLTRREAVDQPPNYFIRNLDKNELNQVTHFQHPTPQLANVTKELVRYEREDGVQLTGTLYLPDGYDAEKDGPLPTIMWAYPQEYKSADAAGQVTDSPYRFIRVGWWSPLLWLVHGYAVFDDPSMPIVGQGEEEPNDTFVEQLVSSAQAAIDVCAERGVTDPDRVAIGGHSYGAFMTANLLTHSDLFRAGIARSGAYNRTLTPFGFQSEERSFWEAPEVYFTMSPFMHADKMNEPLLLIHGEADNNSGTYPLQSERYYDALKGHGATVRLVMLPHESHGYRARESIMHVLWESTEWLDKYVKNAPTRGALEIEKSGMEETQ